MNLSQKIALNTIIQFVGKFISVILALVATAIITRYLGNSGFGAYTTIFTFTSLFSVLADFGITLVTSQMLGEPQRNQQKVINNIFTFRVVSALFFLSLAPLASLFTPYSAEIKWGIFLASFAFLFTVLNQVFVGIFQKNLKLEKVSIAEIASRIFLLLGIVIVYFKDFGLVGIILVTLIANLISFLIHYYFSNKIIQAKFEFDFEYWKLILKKSWPLAITILFNLIYLKTDTLILSLVKDEAAVGIYGAAYKVIDVLVMVPFMYCGIILPVLTERWVNNEKEIFFRAIQKSFDAMLMLAIPMIIGTLMIGTRIMKLIAGAEFEASGAPLQILIWATGAIFVGTIFSHVVIAMEKQRKLIPGYIFTAITAFAGYLIFIPRYSYIGAAWMTVYSETIIMLFSFWIAWKYSGLKLNFETLPKIALSSFLMFGFIYFAEHLPIIIIIILSMLIYFTSLYLIKGISPDLFSLNKKYES